MNPSCMIWEHRQPATQLLPWPAGRLIFQGDFAAYDSIIAAGGDGTAARIVQELARREKKPRLGIIPIGTGNDLARVSGAYRLYKQKGLRPLVEALLAGSTRRLDVFSVNGELFFTNYCGIGLDAKISNDYNRLRHSPFMRAAAAVFGGRAAYAWFAGRNLLYHMPFALELQYADAGTAAPHAADRAGGAAGAGDEHTELCRRRQAFGPLPH